MTGAVIEWCVVGSGPASFSDPGEPDTGDAIRVDGGDSGTIRDNLIGFSGGSGIGIKDAVGWQIEGNEIRDNAGMDAELNGISAEKSSGTTIRGNLIRDSLGAGIDTLDSTGTNTIENNTIHNNGSGGAENPGIRLFGTGNRVDRNVIFANHGAGVMVTYASLQNIITRNSIYGNGPSTGQIGIDLLYGIKPPSSPFVGDDQKVGTPLYVTKNDKDDKDPGGNNLVNFPILETAAISGSNLILTGFALPGSQIELFIPEPDPLGVRGGEDLPRDSDRGVRCRPRRHDGQLRAGPHKRTRPG